MIIYCYTKFHDCALTLLGLWWRLLMTLESSLLSMMRWCALIFSPSQSSLIEAHHWRRFCDGQYWRLVKSYVHSVWSYVLHLNYPKSMKNTFQFIQQVLLMLGHSELKPRLQTLKNNVKKCKELPWEATCVLPYNTLKCVLSLHISAISAQLIFVHTILQASLKLQRLASVLIYAQFLMHIQALTRDLAYIVEYFCLVRLAITHLSP